MTRFLEQKPEKASGESHLNLIPQTSPEALKT